MNNSVALNKLVVLVLLGGFLVLLPEIRFDHSDVLAETWKGYIPLVYCASMVIVTVLGLACWNSFGRKLLLFGYATALVVGLLGFYFHNQRNLPGRVIAMVDTLAQPVTAKKHGPPPPSAPAPIGKSDGKTMAKAPKPLISRNGAPVFAPLSFVGLGLIGVLVCMKRFQPR